jgi:anti-sigma-K factor RskA
MTDQRSPSSDWPELAGEYALGLLVGEELQRARELERTNEDFRADVARWTARLSPLLDDVEPVAPPASAWTAIERGIGIEPANDNVVDLRRSMERWRRIAAGMTAVAASLLLVILVGKVPGRQAVGEAGAAGPAPMVAMLSGTEAGTTVVASWDPQEHQLVLAVPEQLPSDTTHSHELWVIPKGGKPRSLGVLPASRQMHMRLAETLARLLEQGSTIAISVEPRGGSPTGKPTGPVVASGALKQA